MCSARHLRLSTSEIFDVTASMPSLDIQKYPPVARWIFLFKQFSPARSKRSRRACAGSACREAPAAFFRRSELSSAHGVHERNLLQDYGIMHRFVRVLAPGERSVALYENRRNAHRVNSVERFNYDLAGLLFVLAADLLRGHRPGAGDLVVEVVALGGAHRLNANARLRERGRPAAVGVYNSSDSRESAVRLQVSRRVAGGLYDYHSALAILMTETAQPRPSARNC